MFDSVCFFESEIALINREDQKRRSNFFEIERQIKIKREQIDRLKEKENSIKIDGTCLTYFKPYDIL